MPKYKTTSYENKKKIFSSFWNGFNAYSGALGGSLYVVGSGTFSSFADDQKNLRSDFIKSYISVLKSEDAVDKKQMSLNLGDRITTK